MAVFKISILLVLTLICLVAVKPIGASEAAVIHATALVEYPVGYRMVADDETVGMPVRCDFVCPVSGGRNWVVYEDVGGEGGADSGTVVVTIVNIAD